MEKKLEPHQTEALNKITELAEPPRQAQRPRREFKARPEVKINKPFAALAGVKIGK